MTYTSKETTITKKLNQSHLANVTYQAMLDQEKHATHVVSSITYGRNAHFKFESVVNEGENRDDVEGDLKVAIEALKLDGEGSVERTSEEKKFDEETSCRFFGDYSGITPPLNLAQAKATMLAIATDDTNSLGVPITVTLTPLSSLTNAATKLVAELSAGAINETARLLQDIEDIQVSLQTLESSQTSREFSEYRTTVGVIANVYRNRSSQLKSDLCKILPKIKGGGETYQKNVQELMKIIRDYDSSSFSKEKTNKWLAKLEAEVVYVDNLIAQVKKKEQLTLATCPATFRSAKLNVGHGMFYFTARFRSCLQITGNEK